MYKAFCPKPLVWLLAWLILITVLCTPLVAQDTLLPGQWKDTALASAAKTASTTAKVRALVINGTTVVAATNSGIWNTTDNGTTWTQGNTGLTNTDVRSLVLSGTTLYAGTNGGGVFRSTDGTNWTATNTGLTHSVVNALAANGTDVYAGTNGGGVFLLSGTTWKAVNNGISAQAQVFSLTISGNDLLAGGQLVFNDARHVFRSSDKGTTWKATGAANDTVNNPPFTVYSIGINGTTLLAASSAGLYRSTDNGVTWVLSNSLPLRVLNLLYVPTVSAFYASGVTLDGALYGVSVSTDNGATWRASSYGLAGANALAVSGTNLYAANTAADGVSISVTQPPTAASVSATDYRAVSGHAASSIASIFGTALATGTASAPSTPLPTSLAGTTVTVRDSKGDERLAPLFFVSGTQINYQVPAGTAAGWAHLAIKSGNGTLSYATANITSGAFGLFTADNSGAGVPAAYIQRVRANGQQSIELVGQFDGTKWVTVPIDLGAATDRVYLVLFGTGFRGWDGAANPVTGYFKLDALTYLPVQADYAGVQGGFIGVDQINLLLPRALQGAGEISVYVTATTGPSSNVVKIRIL